MSRHPQHRSLIERLFDGVSRLPWWLNVLLAVAVWFALGQVSGPEVLHTLAKFARIILPMLFLAGAGIGLLRLRSR